MRFSVGTNFDDALVDQLSGVPEVADFYGSLPRAPVGHGRPFASVPKVTRTQVEQHIRRIHAAGRTFTYLLNAPSLGGRELRPEVRPRVAELVDWLADAGADGITVTAPTLMEMLRARVPELAVKISHNATVLTLPQARMYQSMGAAVICLHRNTYRNFPLLRRMVRELSVPLQLICTSDCVRGCPNQVSLYHMSITASLTAEGRQPFESHRHGQGYCFSWCHLRKLEHPEEIVKGGFVLPEDLHRYEAIGIADIKLDTRVLATPVIVERVRAYHARRSTGNLLGLLSLLQLAYQTRVGGQMGTGGDTTHAPAGHAMPEAAARFLDLSQEIDFEKLIHANPAGLDGLLDRFEKVECGASCEGCSWCATFAARALRLDPGLRLKVMSILRDYRKWLMSR